MANSPASNAVQPRLSRDVSFWGMTVTQFLGAFNDNLFKQVALLMCIDYATRIKAATGVVKFNVWEASRPGLAAWAKAMRQIASTP